MLRHLTAPNLFLFAQGSQSSGQPACLSPSAMIPVPTRLSWTVQITLCQASEDARRVNSSLQMLNLQDNLCKARKLTTMLNYLCCSLQLQVRYIFRSRTFLQTTSASDDCNVQFSFQRRVSAQQRVEIITAARSGSSPHASTNQPPISLDKRIFGLFPGEISHNSR